MKKTLYWILLIFAFVANAAQQTPDEALRVLLASNSIDSAQTAVYIWNIDDDYSVAAHLATTPIIPASVMKCVTTGALASVFPYNETIKTKVFLQGTRNGESFIGVLKVEGAGDPSLGDGRHNGQADFTKQITEALSKAGIKRLAGEIIIDDSLFAGPAVHPSWMSADLDQAYGTGCHAFNFEGNASGKKAVTDPSAVFRRRLETALRENGIAIEGFPDGTDIPETSKNKKLLTEYESPRIGNLMRSCMFRSDNLYAESFLRLFGLRNGADGSTDMSAEMAMQHWDALNFPLDGVDIVDGSGLSRDNSLTAEFLGTVLRYRMSDPEYVSFFPLAGEEGTVKNFLKDTPLQGRLALKTGSMNGIQSYAGYALDSDYQPTHVVVIMTNGLKNRGEFRSALTRFFLALFS